MSGSQQLLLGGAPTVTPVDPYFYSVTSLLHGDGTNGGQNNTFLDSSTNNFTITRNGNTTQGSFSPFSQTGWSNYFDGTGDYLSMSDAGLAIGNGDFTLECWVYCTTTPSDKSIFEGRSGGTGTTGFTLTAFTGTTVRIFSGSALITSGTINYVNTWCHIAVSRVSGTTTLYVNGISQGTTTSLGNLTDSSFLIGAGKYASPPTVDAFFTGYISNFRIVKGTAVYTANFTPPTTPLTAITNTSLLTCQSNRFRDASTNNFTITRNGDVSVQPFSPFNPTTAYSTSSIGGSGYFDGSGDLLTVSSANQILPSGTQNFSVEFYTYFVSAPSLYPIFLESKEATNGFQIVYTNDGGANQNKLGIGVYGVGLITSATFNTYFRQWVHIVATRNGNDFRLFFNGTLVAYASNTQSFVTVGTQTIGAQASGLYPTNAYITNIRTCLGAIPTDYQTSSTTTGTQIFTPPSAPVTTTSQGASSVAFLANFTNGAIFDNAAVADYETVGNAQISTSVKKYGTGSIAFDGTGDYLVTYAPSTDMFAFGTGDFTVEFWYYSNNSGVQQILYDSRPSGTNGAYITFYKTSGNVLELYVNTGVRLTGTTTLSSGVWYHVALCRVASQTKIFVNGTQSGPTYADTTTYLNGANRPVIGSDSATVGNLPINGYIDDLRVTKGVGRYLYNFTPPTAALPDIGGTVTLTADPYYEYTTLLLPGNGTNGAQNNTFLDSSTNAFTITRNGNTTQGTFSPFSQTGWGNYFDGTGDYLETPSNAAFTLGSSGDFTIECWVYLTATSGNYAAFLTTWADALSNYTNRWWVGTNADGILRWYDSSGNTGIVDSVVLTLNTWFHVAVVRSGSTITLYKNGTAIGTQTTNQAYTTQGSVKMGYSGTNSGYYFGYISNARVVKGTAVYTSNFTPPTTPLTAITNTSLLTCQSNRFIDNSTNNFAITRNGDVSVQAFSPFNPTASWSAATYGGSGYFDGSGDYLTAADNAAFTLGSGDWCSEGWVYPTYFPAFARLWGQDQAGASTNGSVALFMANGAGTSSPATLNLRTVVAGSMADYNYTVTLVPNQWNHIAAYRISGTIYLAVNGSVQTARTTAGSVNDSSLVYAIGANQGGTENWQGYISGHRLVVGSAVYTSSNFTPPTAPLTAITNTSLLLNYTNAGIYDATSKNDLETVGNAQISTTQSKFGGSSMYFDGTGDYLINYSSVSQNAMTFGTGDFTIEGWVNFSSTSGQQGIIDAAGSVSTGTSGQWNVNYNSNNLNFGNHGVGNILAVSFTPATGTWYHIAFTRYGSTVRGFINGVLGGTATSSVSFSAGGVQVGIGASFAAFNGYINDLRVTKGIARYTSNFTPPTTAFLTL